MKGRTHSVLLFMTGRSFWMWAPPTRLPSRSHPWRPSHQNLAMLTVSGDGTVVSLRADKRLSLSGELQGMTLYPPKTMTSPADISALVTITLPWWMAESLLRPVWSARIAPGLLPWELCSELNGPWGWSTYATVPNGSPCWSICSTSRGPRSLSCGDKKTYS